MKKGNRVLGEFDLQSGKLQVSDPCYKDGTKVLKAVKGKWIGHVSHDEHGRPIQLLTFSKVEPKEGGWYRARFSCPVDSGQVGIFDQDHFQKESCVEGLHKVFEDDPYHNDFYRACCGITLGKKSTNKHFTVFEGKRRYKYQYEYDPKFIQAGVCKHGVNSSTTYGDGTYPVYLQKNADGKVVGVRVVFSDDDEGGW
jgi:hypothetical protein